MHDTLLLVSNTIPVNIGFIAAYTKKVFGDAFDISLFKYPKTAIDAINYAPPDILGLSNYSWNSELSEWVSRLAKGRNSEMVIVQGAPTSCTRPRSGWISCCTIETNLKTSESSASRRSISANMAVKSLRLRRGRGRKQRHAVRALFMQKTGSPYL